MRAGFADAQAATLEVCGMVNINPGEQKWAPTPAYAVKKLRGQQGMFSSFLGPAEQSRRQRAHPLSVG